MKFLRKIKKIVMVLWIALICVYVAWSVAACSAMLTDELHSR